MTTVSAFACAVHLADSHEIQSWTSSSYASTVRGETNPYMCVCPGYGITETWSWMRVSTIIISFAQEYLNTPHEISVNRKNTYKNWCPADVGTQDPLYECIYEQTVIITTFLVQHKCINILISLFFFFNDTIKRITGRYYMRPCRYLISHYSYT